jgi:hypothetical protein
MAISISLKAYMCSTPNCSAQFVAAGGSGFAPRNDGATVAQVEASAICAKCAQKRSRGSLRHLDIALAIARREHGPDAVTLGTLFADKLAAERAANERQKIIAAENEDRLLARMEQEIGLRALAQCA